MIPDEITKIINDYIEQIKIHENKVKAFKQINNINVLTISLCIYCRCVKITSKIYNNNNRNCNHYFFLNKPIFTLNNTKLLRQNMFNFYCDICNRYDLFFSHLHNHNH